MGCAFRVANALGHGFAEKIYENTLPIRRDSPGWALCSSGKS
ncbi:GxxExxY protein [Acidisphaera sp. S103]